MNGAGDELREIALKALKRTNAFPPNKLERRVFAVAAALAATSREEAIVDLPGDAEADRKSVIEVLVMLGAEASIHVADARSRQHEGSYKQKRDQQAADEERVRQREAKRLEDLLGGRAPQTRKETTKEARVVEMRIARLEQELADLREGNDDREPQT